MMTDFIHGQLREKQKEAALAFYREHLYVNLHPEEAGVDSIQMELIEIGPHAARLKYPDFKCVSVFFSRFSLEP